MANELVFPALYPASEELTLVDDTTSVHVPAFAAGLIQRVSRIGPRWQMTARFESLSQQERHNLIGFLSLVKGRAMSFIYVPRHPTFRGSFPASELLPNTAFDATTGWTASGELALYADANRLRLTRSAVTGDRYVNAAQITGLTNGAAYLLRGTAIRGKGNARWALRAGSTAGANTYIDSGLTTTFGHAAAANTIAATTAFVSVYDYSSGRSIGDYQIHGGLSFSRCFRVNGVSQGGSALNVKNLPASSNGLLLAGDTVAVYTNAWEIKRVTAALNSDASGLGHLQFESALRVSPADSAPIAVHAPMCKFMLAGDPRISTRPGMYSDVEVQMTEDMTP